MITHIFYLLIIALLSDIIQNYKHACRWICIYYACVYAFSISLTVMNFILPPRPLRYATGTRGNTTFAVIVQFNFIKCAIFCMLQILESQLEPLTEPQRLDFFNLRQSSQQAEDALSQGMDKLQQTLAKTLEPDQILCGESYGSQMADALEKFEALESFVSQVTYPIECLLELV